MSFYMGWMQNATTAIQRPDLFKQYFLALFSAFKTRLILMSA